MPQSNKPTAAEIVARSDRTRILCRNVLGSGDGKELLDALRRVYVDGKLYGETDRDTVYMVAQRDLIMELIYNVQQVPDEPILDGEDIS